MLKFSQFCNLKSSRKNKHFLEIAAQASETGDFPNNFLRFWSF